MSKSENWLVGVSLVGLSGNINTNLGLVVLPNRQTLKATELRTRIQQEIVSCPANFSICTKQGWSLTTAQEEILTASDIISEDDVVYIKVKYDLPKVGVKNQNGQVIGFIYTSQTSKLKTLRNLINEQIILGSNLSEIYQFLDENCWPISLVQEGHMTVQAIVIGHCVSTTINSNPVSPRSPRRGPPFKRLRLDPEKSFRSVKDVSRQLGVQFDRRPSAKQVLISYVRSEAESYALRLKEQLTSLDCSVYLDLHEIQTGVDWQDSLNFAVSECQVFVPLVTKKYGETQWTNREVKLADVLGKFILPVNFDTEWPPRCLAIQFATTQYIPWIPADTLIERLAGKKDGEVVEWLTTDVALVAEKVCTRIKTLQLSHVPSLIKRGTVVKSCPCVVEDNPSATSLDRDGKPLVMICLHPQQHKYGKQLQTMLENEGVEVWCTTQLGRSHIEHIDSLASSYEGISYSMLNSHDVSNVPGCQDNEDLRNIQIFQEKADDAGVVVLILSELFATSRVCKQQVFYCEHRKRVIPVLYEDFRMPDWLAMLVGSCGLERRSDEDFKDVFLYRIKAELDPSLRLGRMSTTQFSPGRLSLSASSNSSPFHSPSRAQNSVMKNGTDARVTGTDDGEEEMITKPTLSSASTIIL